MSLSVETPEMVDEVASVVATEDVPPAALNGDQAPEDTPAKPKRGRSRKSVAEENVVAEGAASDPSAAEQAEKPKRTRTRKKVEPEQTEIAATTEGAAVSDAARAAGTEKVTEEAPEGTPVETPEEVPAKPKRGRPRKKAVAEVSEGDAPAQDTPAQEVRAQDTQEPLSPAPVDAGENQDAAPQAEKPKRGRSRKKVVDETPAEADTRAQQEEQENRADCADQDTVPSVDEALDAPVADSQGESTQATKNVNAPALSPTESGSGEGESTEAAANHPKGERAEKQAGAQRRNDRNDRNDRNNRDDRNTKSNQKSQNKQGSNRNDRNDRRRQRRQHDNRNREIVPSITKEELLELKVADLRNRAKELEIDSTGLKKAELVDAVYDATLKKEGFLEVSGVLDIMADGYGFLRATGYLPGEGDTYVGTSIIRRNSLRKGDFVVGQTRPARDNEKFAAIQKIISVNGKTIEELRDRPRFADLTPVYPDERLIMEHGKNTITARVIDLCAPIGKGQRGLIVSPPKAGKTTVLKNIAASITANNPEVHLMCLLVDERPEEVTDMQRSIRGEVISSTFDMPSENHIAVAELVIERAKRLVEAGQDVVILLDSITRLARAYNLAQPASGRILSGGVDSTALYPPKRFLGAARNIEGGGSLTILASALIDTGSKMDEVIFEEFKGTGNMELKLDRNLADRRIFPAIDPVSSGTRKEELLLDQQEAPLIWAVRRILSNMNNTERAMDMLIKSLKQTDTNQEFLVRTAKKAQTQHGKADDTFEL